MCGTGAVSTGGIGNAGLAMQAVGGIGETYAAYRRSAGERQGYEYQSQVARNNAKVAEWQAQDAISRGVAAKQAIQVKKAGVYGAQRAAFASRNVALDEGSALHILTDTLFLGARDENLAEDNAAKEAWALRNQAAGYESNAQFLANRAAQQNPFLDAAGTALTAGGRVASSWYTMRTRTISPGGSVWQ